MFLRTPNVIDREDTVTNDMEEQLEGDNEDDKDGSVSVKGHSDMEDTRTDIPSDDDGYDTDLDQETVLGKTRRLSFDKMVMEDYIKECNDLGAIPVSYFLKHVKDKTFEMKYHGLGSLGAKAIAKPLELNTFIECLDLEGNDIQGNGAEYICRTLKENTFITVMNLSDNGLGTKGAQTICELLKSHKIIKELDLSSNQFTDNDGQYFCNMLLENKTLQKLILKYNRFESTAAKWFKTALSENEFLRHLDLSWNNIHLKGAVYIAEMVRENYGLKYLDISMNGFGNTGAAGLGAALKVNQSLQELNIMCNRITFQGAMQFATGLVVNEVLKIVRIGRNPITSAGAFGVLCAIGNNKHCALHLLDMRDVIVKEDFESLLDNLNSEKDTGSLSVIHAGLLHEHKIQFSDMDPRDHFERDPMTRLKRYAGKRKLRLVDLFRQFDKDQSWSVSKEEFIKGIKSTGIEMSEEEIMKLMGTLDKDKNGEIYYKEFMTGDSSNRAQLRQILREANEQKEKEIETKKKSIIKDFKFDDET